MNRLRTLTISVKHRRPIIASNLISYDSCRYHGQCITTAIHTVHASPLIHTIFGFNSTFYTN